MEDEYILVIDLNKLKPLFDEDDLYCEMKSSGYVAKVIDLSDWTMDSILDTRFFQKNPEYKPSDPLSAMINTNDYSIDQKVDTLIRRVLELEKRGCKCQK